ncbi:hypothetical protein TSOC_004115 [Tetrabaena socialis]|uniref:BACK domain-containing protein n=1 Tax=Tetrabaena socialis TaxID=47790 RepID=A0A2J8A9P8_9CHLO|nr:hypothetical protein TSOC_004115 [Tetrabaena socialis]|eukprot:PNH09246.1 hypothetical protein TSOC_004115 [Tetrabaena socialis]
MLTGNPVVAKAVAELFGSDEEADCKIVFYVKERVPGEDGASEEAGCSPSRRPADDDAAPSRKTRKVEREIGSSLPGHKFVLRSTSEWFRTKIGRWAGEAPNVGGADDLGLELRVSLNSEEEEPAARAAIGFAYTGRVQAGSIREALEVRRQAAYLQVEGGVEACDEFIRGRLQAASGSSSSNGGAHGGAAQPPALEFFECVALFPDSVEGPSFAALLACAKQALVTHFPDALAVLNTPRLRKQLLALPAVAVEVLLAAEAFGTDTEASVLLLLAVWMEANFNRTDAPTRERLCRLVRLVQLGRTYLSCVLPALAAAFSKGGAENSPLSHNLTREELSAAGETIYDLTSPWYSFAARPQCVPDEGATYGWSISEQELKEALEAGGDEIRLRLARFQEGMSYMAARGFLWRPSIDIESGASAAGLFLCCDTSSAYQLPKKRVAGVVCLDTDLAVHCWEGSAREVDIVLGFGALSQFCIGHSRGTDDVLPLLQPAEIGGAGGPLAAWGRYLHGGKLSGSLKLRPPPRAAAGAVAAPQ